MNLFIFFNIPVSFYPDLELIRKRYLENSRNSHPDIAQGEDEMKYMELTALNNKAYSTLKSEEKRIDYILNELYPAKDKVKLPPEFLMEMMDTNESLLEAKLEEDEDAIHKVKREVEQLQLSLKSSLNSLLKEFDFQDLDSLDKIRDLSLRLNYLKRIL
jgi:molecular chaperone HscB